MSELIPDLSRSNIHGVCLCFSEDIQRKRAFILDKVADKALYPRGMRRLQIYSERARSSPVNPQQKETIEDSGVCSPREIGTEIDLAFTQKSNLCLRCSSTNISTRFIPFLSPLRIQCPRSWRFDDQPRTPAISLIGLTNCHAGLEEEEATFRPLLRNGQLWLAHWN